MFLSMLTILKQNLLRVLHALFYHGRLDSTGNTLQPRGFNKITSRFNQYLIENGRSPRWVWSAEACRTFWGSDVNKSVNPNDPQHYSEKSTRLIETNPLIYFLHEFWQPYIQTDCSLMELGCNCGANLEILRKLGYRNLAGVEINRDAIELMSRLFPELYGEVSIEVGSLEDTLPELATDSIDVVFSVAVLMHLHPASHNLFSEIVRVARQHIVVVEPEFGNCDYVFSRNYRRVFQRLGCVQLSAMKIGIDPTPEVLRDHHGSMVRFFAAPNFQRALAGNSH